MTKVLLGALVCAMLALTGVVAYSHFATDANVATAPEESGCCSPKSGCSSCSSCCTHEMPAVESAGCTECAKAKAAAEAAKAAEVKEEASEPK